jgi:hypothetical protein
LWTADTALDQVRARTTPGSCKPMPFFAAPLRQRVVHLRRVGSYLRYFADGQIRQPASQQDGRALMEREILEVDARFD